MLYLSNGCIYTGYFRQNVYHGQGTFVWTDNKQVYEGNWVQGKMFGKGKLTSQNGDIYIGEFKYNKRNGKGTLKKGKNGAQIQGVWEDDKLLKTNGE